MVMSTYLVAFVVGPLEATKPIHAGGVPIRVVHRPGQGDRTSFALDVAAAALDWFADYYAIPYPSDKVDLIAIPDFVRCDGKPRLRDVPRSVVDHRPCRRKPARTPTGRRRHQP